MARPVGGPLCERARPSVRHAGARCPPIPAHIPGQPVRVLFSTRPAPGSSRAGAPARLGPTAKEWSDDIRA
jgi:hypothetical protein